MGRLSKDKRDIYYREAKREGFRARSAFKLLQIDEELNLLEGVRNVVDLCAAPGSWSQVLASRLLAPRAEIEAPSRGGGGAAAAADAASIVAVDMYAIQRRRSCLSMNSRGSRRPFSDFLDPIRGVTESSAYVVFFSSGDGAHCRRSSGAGGHHPCVHGPGSEVLGHLRGDPADLVVCDGAPDATGVGDFDEYVQHQLLLSALLLAEALLRPGGGFVAKIFRGEHAAELMFRAAFASSIFDDVVVCKPRASRNSSQEAFVVCRGFAPLAGPGTAPALYSPGRHAELVDLGPGSARLVVPFVACGARDGPDADTNYAVGPGHRLLGPVAPPLQAPYREALEERRGLKRAAAAAAAGAGPPA
ncbi:unnamed protein product [Prorocentrum cordatum]|uniref:Ribosomal RNA methyltransferase FtsJ domain-containing protein n=1 Tax=Prorocentrum cordatum TaxID=2364126 RepID=A0ABN9V8L7_9DINO|nr:unnamed protein product [Polarella glacialis]